LDPTGVKKILEDYEQMLQYYTLTRTKNKMKDFEAKFEEWWEVAKEYFTKELDKNLAQHKIDERIMRYKLEAYQEKFQILFVAV
jgi:Fic family protein